MVIWLYMTPILSIQDIAGPATNFSYFINIVKYDTELEILWKTVLY